MSTTHERIVQAEEGVAQVQGVLGHAQDVLGVAEQVEVAASRSRRLLKLLAVLTVLGLVVFIIVKVTSRRNAGPELSLVEEPSGDAEPDGGPPAS